MVTTPPLTGDKDPAKVGEVVPDYAGMVNSQSENIGMAHKSQTDASSMNDLSEVNDCE